MITFIQIDVWNTRPTDISEKLGLKTDGEWWEVRGVGRGVTYFKTLRGFKRCVNAELEEDGHDYTVLWSVHPTENTVFGYWSQNT